jgi:hypothetical protein
MMPAVMSSCHGVSPFSVSRSGRISHYGQCPGEWVYKSMMAFMPRGMTPVMTARVAFGARFSQVSHGGPAHGGRKAPLGMTFPAVRRIDDNHTCHKLSPHPVGNAERPALDNKSTPVGVKIKTDAPAHFMFVEPESMRAREFFSRFILDRVARAEIGEGFRHCKIHAAEFPWISTMEPFKIRDRCLDLTRQFMPSSVHAPGAE